MSTKSESKEMYSDEGQDNDSLSSDNDFQADDDEDEDDEKDERRISGHGSQLQHASMTESYSEILNSPTDSGGALFGIGDEVASTSGPYPIPKRRPGSLPTVGKNSFPQGTVSIGDGNMMHFVADNLEHKIKAASPNTRKDSEAAGRLHSFDMSTDAQMVVHKQFLSSIPQIDPNVLNDIEIEAQYLASNLDNLTENLCNLLHSISSIAADNVETYKTAVNKLTDCMDANIKTMYTIMAKTEEISNSFKTMEGLALRIKDLKRLVDNFDNMT